MPECDPPGLQQCLLVQRVGLEGWGCTSEAGTACSRTAEGEPHNADARACAANDSPRLFASPFSCRAELHSAAAAAAPAACAVQAGLRWEEALGGLLAEASGSASGGEGGQELPPLVQLQVWVGAFQLLFAYVCCPSLV